MEIPMADLQPQLNEKYDLFVSYATNDDDKVKKICDSLENKHGIRCYLFDRDSQTGKLIDQNIKEGMEQSAKTLIFLSPSYVDSLYCISEAKMACENALKNKNDTVMIPVLLYPDTDIPAFLKLIQYIDDQREKDTAAKIADAFNNKKTFSSIASQNADGELVWSILAKKESPFWKKGSAYIFHNLTERKILKFRQEDKHCEKPVQKIIEILNASALMKNLGVLAGVTGILASFMIGLSCYFAILAFFFLGMLLGDDVSYDFLAIPIVTAGSVPLVIIVYVIARYCLARKTGQRYNDVRQQIWCINKQMIEEHKCYIELVLIKGTSATMCLNVLRCNTEPCKKELFNKALELDSTRNQNEVKEKIDDCLEELLKEIMMRGFLFQYLKLDNSECYKHFYKAKCFCQILEDRSTKI